MRDQTTSPMSTASTNTQHTSRLPTQGTMDAFFASHTGFDYDKNKPFFQEFQRLVAVKGWSDYNPSRAYQKAQKRFRRAMVVEFNTRYGTDAKDLQAWRNLCSVLRVQPKESITQCKNEIRKVHVNLVDLTQAHDPTSVKHFRTPTDLRNYTKQTGKIFPKATAKDDEGGLLQALLREMTEKPKVEENAEASNSTAV